jgi:hypothetical protein
VPAKHICARGSSTVPTDAAGPFSNTLLKSASTFLRVSVRSLTGSAPKRARSTSSSSASSVPQSTAIDRQCIRGSCAWVGTALAAAIAGNLSRTVCAMWSRVGLAMAPTSYFMRASRTALDSLPSRTSCLSVSVWARPPASAARRPFAGNWAPAALASTRARCR